MPGLIITNGDSAADILTLAGRRDTILPWRDVLHEGPIVAGSIEDCSRVRVDYLAGRLRLDASEVALNFAERDAGMRRHAEFDRIEIWLEHDLYDQLQLVQILSFFADEGRTEGLVLIQADDFLGHQRPDTILHFAHLQRPVTEADLELADFVWADLAMPTPEAVARRLDQPMDDLPFLNPALHRFLDELPSPQTGLGRTEATALRRIAAGSDKPVAVFHETIATEPAAFMGDASFFGLLDDLAFSPVPLIAGLTPPAAADFERFRTASLTLTPAGADVLAGRQDHVALSGIDRWWAGTRLLGRDCWRYGRDEMRLVPPEGAGA